MIKIESTMQWTELLGKTTFSCPSLGTKLSKDQKKKKQKNKSVVFLMVHIEKIRPDSEVTSLLSLKRELKLFSCSLIK